MNCCVKLFLLAVIASTLIFGYIYHILTYVPPLPHLENTWWGHGDPSKEDSSIKPFKINVPDKVLNDLNHRLSNARKFVPPLEGIQQQYGINTDLLKDIVEFWRTKYNWREREKYLNQYPQYTVSIQGLKIHYIHVKPAKTEGVEVLPLLILHGWPGSVRELYDIIPMLTKPQKGYKFVFEVIIPSLPGYGFSDPAVRPGLGAAQMAVVFKNFMKRLGFEKYYLQGGDWGAVIVTNMAKLFPEKIAGVHSNMCGVFTPLSSLKIAIGSFFPSLVVDKEHEKKMYPYSKKITDVFLLESGYMHLQATKPDTIGVALNESPVGLAAYILEKFTTWTNPEWKNLADGGLTKKFSYTALLDNVMMYWVTSSITTSVRLYSETFNKNQFSLGLDRIPVTTPTACARFSHELLYQSDTILKEIFKNLIHSSDFDDGGHFAAFEVPKLLADDIFVAVEKFIAHEKQKRKTEL